VSVTSRTASGRVGTLALATDRGTWSLRGNEIRFVLRAPGGEILNSTYFTPHVEGGVDGRVARVTLRGHGNGHGVGMCQWGAIGRARAGHDVRRILEAYYTGATVGQAY
jgi:stage II sporulation protein D